MQRFDLYALARLMNTLQSLECSCRSNQLLGFGAQRVEPEFTVTVKSTLQDLSQFFVSHGMRECAEISMFTQGQMDKPLLDVSAAAVQLNTFKGLIINHFNQMLFLKINSDRSEYLHVSNLFGSEVQEAFPSSTRDIVEAGNCLALECGTACVFHLMRAVEFALRAVARDREIEFGDKPLQEKEWGQILSKLETVVGGLRNDPRSCWSVPETRDKQIRFYAEVVQELRGFNDAWRRHVSHADTLAFYERDGAVDVFKHVRSFMQKLSENISEGSITPKYWTS